MLVISSVMSTTISSERSSRLRVVSWTHGQVSTMPRAWVARSASRICFTAPEVMSSAISGLDGASSTRAPELWVTMTDSSDSRSTTPSAMMSAIDLFLGFMLSITPTSPNWKLASTMHTRLPGAAAPPVRGKGGHDPAGLVRLRPRLGVRAGGGRPLGDAAQLLLLPQEDLADRRHQLVGAEGLDQELPRPGQHRAAEGGRPALDAHHHDGRGRQAGRQPPRP